MKISRLTLGEIQNQSNHKIRSDEVSDCIRLILERLAKGLIDKVGKECRPDDGAIIDVHNTFQRYTLAVIFYTVYKKDGVINFNLNEFDSWTTMMDEGARSIMNPVVCISIMFPFMRPLCTFLAQFDKVGFMVQKVLHYIEKSTDLNRSAREYHNRHQKRLSLTVENHRERSFEDLKRSGKFERRLIDTIIDAYLEKRINYRDFVGSTFFLLLAGFETTADTITCLIWHLAKNQEIQEKMRKAIQTEGIDADYVVWCIQETIRWHPAVPLGTGRILSEDIQVNGILYPKGAFVMPSTHSIHHDDRIWPEADKFKPERWANSSEFHPAAFMGFGLGPRNCLGGKMAIHEIKLVMQMVLTKFKIEPCSETPDSYEFTSPGLIYTILDNPIKVKFSFLPTS